MNSFNPMQAPEVVGNPSFQNQMDALNAAQNVQFQDLENELANNETDLSAFEALGEFSNSFSKLGTQVLKDRFEKEMVEGIYLARLNGVPEEDQLTLDMVDREAMEFDSEINAAAVKAEDSDGHSVVANRLRSMSPRMAYAYDREITKAKASNIPNLFTQASAVGADGGLTIIGQDGYQKDYTSLRDPADFAKWWETFEKIIYKQFTGVGHAVMNKDVFPVVEQLIGSQSTDWSETIAAEQKAERVRINKNLVFDLLRGRGNPVDLMDLVRTKTVTRADLTQYILEGIPAGALDGRTLAWMNEATFTHTASGQQVTLAQELGSDWFRIQEAFSVKGQQQQQQRIAAFREATMRAESELRTLGMQDDNGLSSEVFETTARKIYDEYGYMPDFSRLESEFGAKSVQEQQLLELYTEKAQTGQLTYNEFVRLPPSVQAKVKPAFEASGAFRSYQARDKHLSDIAAMVRAPAGTQNSNNTSFTNASVLLKTAEVQKEYKDLVASGMQPEVAFKQIVNEFGAKLDADAKRQDAKFFDTTNGIYLGSVPNAVQAKDARKAFNDRKEDLARLTAAYRRDPRNQHFFNSGFFSTAQLEGISDQLEAGEAPSYTPTMLQAAKILDMSPLQMLKKFAENDTNLKPEFKMELPPPIQILDDSMSPAEKRFLNSISSFKAGSRVISRYQGASTLPTRQSVLEERQALVDVASELGIDPLDLATVIGFETAGTYDPAIVGGEGGNYEGLIQFGIPERAAYGVTPGMSFAEQLRGPVKKYLLDRFKGQNRSTKGATLLDLYRTVLGGNPNASLTGEDAFGTSPQSGVNQMGPHRDAARRRYGF